MWFKLYTNEVFRKREKIAITVVYYEYRRAPVFSERSKTKVHEACMKVYA